MQSVITPAETAEPVLRWCLALNRKMARLAKREGNRTLRRIVLREALDFRRELRGR